MVGVGTKAGFRRWIAAGALSVLVPFSSTFGALERPLIDAGTVSALPGSVASVLISIDPRGAEVDYVEIGMQVAEGFRFVSRADGKPDCAAAADFSERSSFIFPHSDEFPDDGDRTVLGVVGVSAASRESGARAFLRCNVELGSAVATGRYRLEIFRAGAGTNAGTAVEVDTVSGTLLVQDPAEATRAATFTPTPTRTPIATAPPEPTIVAPAEADILRISTVRGMPGGEVRIYATLFSPFDRTSGIENELYFEPEARIARKANGRPDCEFNSDLNLNLGGVAFKPSGCAGDDCSGIKVLALGFAPDLIPNGSVVYSCRIEISPLADASYALPCALADGAHPDGEQQAVSCIDGAVLIGEAPIRPTRTATATRTPYIPPTPGPPGATSTRPRGSPTPSPRFTSGPYIEIGSALGEPGETVSFSVTLRTNRREISGTQNDILFDPRAPIVARTNGRPDCTQVTGSQGGASFAFRPAGCTPGTDCTSVRALILSFDNVDPIPDNSVLYTCKVKVPDDASPLDDFALRCSEAEAGDPNGHRVPIQCAGDGNLFLPDSAATATQAAAPRFSATRTPGESGGGDASASSETGGGNSDGCQVGSGSGGPAWSSIGLVVALSLARLRRRSDQR